MKTRLVVLVLIAIICRLNLSAQTVSDGFNKIDRKEYLESKQIFATLLKANPLEAVAHFGLGQSFYFIGNTDSAKICFQKGVEANPSYAGNYAGLGVLQLASPTDETAGYLKTAVKKSKKDSKALVFIALGYYNLSPKNLSEAKRYIEMAINISSKDAAAYYVNGLIENARKNANEASLQVERAIYFNPSFLESYFMGAELMNGAQNYARAADYLKNVISIDSTYWRAYKTLGELNYDYQDYENAVKNFKIYFKNVPTDNDGTHYAYSLFFMKKYLEAQEIISKLASENPNDFIFLRLLGYISYETKDYLNGKSIMDKFFTLIPKDKILVDDYSYYGKMLSVNGSDSLAIENYNMALSIDSSKIALLDEISKSYLKLKKFESSLEYGNLFVKKKPNVVTADYFQLGKSYYTTASNLDVKVDSIKQLDYYTIADSLFAKVSVYSPTSYLGYFWRARTNSSIDAETTLGLAKPHYEKALEILTKDPVKYKKEIIEVYSYLGFYHYVKNEKEQSIDFWKKLLEIDPENPKAKEAIKALEKKKA